MVCAPDCGRSAHAMFADDTTLLASSRKDICTMIKDTTDALALYGLSLNLDKCMVQTNRRRAMLKPLLVDGHEMPMVSSNKGFKVLGTMFTFNGRTSAEFQARMSAAWGKFHQMWPLLGKRDADMSKRLRLFDMSVSQTALWCNESWLLTRREKS